MPSYPFDKQVKIVIMTMAIHNYIRRHAKCDHHFEKIENDPNFILEEDNDRDDDFQEENHNANTPGAREVKKLRDSIAARLGITCYSSVSGLRKAESKRQTIEANLALRRARTRVEVLNVIS
ncbi:hypothetical protein Q3G72_030534 [Acer saccharum]|nr:hypothetical protein Q3G72_030534 [Acer saccharum]